MTKGLVTVLGANGFLGRHVVRALVKDGWRVRAAVRRPHTAIDLRVIGKVGQIQIVQANLRYKKSVERAISGADAVINLCGIAHKKGAQTFDGVHAAGAKTAALAAREFGISNYIHVSALGAEINSKSEYLASKARGEQAVSAAVPSAAIVRPAVMFGEGDHLFTLGAKIIGWTPVLPLFFKGLTAVRPVYVGDVARAVAKIVGSSSGGETYELAGPTRYTARQLWTLTLAMLDKKRPMIPLPNFMGKIMGFAFEFWAAVPIVNLLIKPVLTRDMMHALGRDYPPSDTLPGLEELGIKAETVEAIMPDALISYRKHGQFHETYAP